MCAMFVSLNITQHSELKPLPEIVFKLYLFVIIIITQSAATNYWFYSFKVNSLNRTTRMIHILVSNKFLLTAARHDDQHQCFWPLLLILSFSFV